MNAEYDRLEKLVIVLQYDSYGEKSLTAFDRMFIHKERSAIYNGFGYKVPEDVETKIQEILYMIKRLNWQSPF